MKPLVRMGDPLLPFGGEVLEGHFLAFGKPVAFVGARAQQQARHDADRPGRLALQCAGAGGGPGRSPVRLRLPGGEHLAWFLDERRAMKLPPQFPGYVEPGVPQWRRWWLALLVSWGAQLVLAWALWPEERGRQELWLLCAAVPLAWLLALALRSLAWQVGLVNHDAHHSTVEAAVRAWWCRRGATLPVEQVLLLGPAGDAPRHYQGLMAAAPAPEPVLPPDTQSPMLRCQVSLRRAEERPGALGRHLARQLLASPWREASWPGLQGLAWAGDEAGERAFVEALAAAGSPLPEARWRLRTLDDLDALIDVFPQACPGEGHGLLCAGVVSLEHAGDRAVPGEAGFVWMIGHRGQVQLHRGEYLSGDEESAAGLCAQMQRYAGLDEAPAHCLALDAASQAAFLDGGWQAAEHQLSGHWGELGMLAPFVGMSLALLQAQESSQPCGWLCTQGERGMAMGVVVHGNG